MNSALTADASEKPAVDIPVGKTSRLIRRIHMFTGLFLAPWMLMYALSTLVMTHQKFVESFYASKNPPFVAERELAYTRSFPADADREEVANQILQDIGLDGTHNVHGWKNGQPLVIDRSHALKPQRITFDASKSKIVIERQEFRAPSILQRMHRRRGYNNYALENTWGFAVDVAVVMMVFWSLSGIWLWWEIKSTRRFGALTLLGGLGLFAVFLALS